MLGSGKKYSGAALNMYVRCGEGVGETSAAFIVSKKQGNAVKRNRIRRILRAAFRKLSPTLSAKAHLAFFPRRASLPLNLCSVESEMAELLNDAGLIY